jgi:peptide/nickel transport system ATP-binding protein
MMAETTGDARDRAPVLTIEKLTVAYRQGKEWLPAVRDFSLRVMAGQTHGLVGESGSGKTTIALTIMRYLGPNGRVEQGIVDFAGQDLLALREEDMRRIWGAQMALVPQDPLSSLNPSIQIGEQLAEPLRYHMGLSRRQAAGRVLDLLEMVRVPDPARVASSYPHQISGGMQQRAMIAMALSTEPRLLILDEPTTALDVTTQAAILDLVRELIHGRETAALYVTHNLGVVARICDRVSVLYAGDLVEDAAVGDLFNRPVHPYTQGLLASVPRLGDNKRAVQLQAIPGRIPSLRERLADQSSAAGCIFTPRCPLAVERCSVERPVLEDPHPIHEPADRSSPSGRLVRCHRWPDIVGGESGRAFHLEQPDQGGLPAGVEPDLRPVLSLDDLQVHFALRRSAGEVFSGQSSQTVKAVDGVDLTLKRGQTLGLVGESGSGKTSLARAIIGLEEATGGRMTLLSMELPSGLPDRTRGMMQQLQIVFQNPEEALNPYLTVGETLRRPFMILRQMSRQEADEAVIDLLAAVRLPAGYTQRLPHQLSGGEKQRVAIARAFAANPELLISDEPVSALDVSVQASILNLLNELQAERGSSNLFISHDLAVVGYLADVIAVIYAGNLMEVARADDLFRPPYHPYTEALLSAIPQPDPEVEQEAIRLQGDVPSQVDIPGGCPFHPRCPRFLGDICTTETPPWREVADEADPAETQDRPASKRIFCHIPLAELKRQQSSPISSMEEV